MGSAYPRHESVFPFPISFRRSWCSKLDFILSNKPIIIQYKQIVAQLLSYPAGLFLARFIPRITILGIALNPGPFTIKEHVIVTIMAGVGANAAYAVCQLLVDSTKIIFSLDSCRTTSWQYNAYITTKHTAGVSHISGCLLYLHS